MLYHIIEIEKSDTERVNPIVSSKNVSYPHASSYIKEWPFNAGGGGKIWLAIQKNITTQLHMHKKNPTMHKRIKKSLPPTPPGGQLFHDIY